MDTTSQTLGIVYSGTGCHYRLAGLCERCDPPSDYQIRIYDSQTKTWSSRILPNPCPRVKVTEPEKVVKLGEVLLGWVDLSRGLLACDLNQEPPCARFIPLPMPLPQNRGGLKKASEDEQGFSARWLRDLTCVNGVLKFIEMEHLFKESEKFVDPSDTEILFDSDLIAQARRTNQGMVGGP